MHYSRESKIETDMFERDSDKKPEANHHTHTHTSAETPVFSWSLPHFFTMLLFFLPRHTHVEIFSIFFFSSLVFIFAALPDRKALFAA